MVALISGPLGVLQQIILLVVPNSDPLWQSRLFAVITLISFVIAAIWLWWLEHRKVSTLQQQLVNAQAQTHPRIVGAIGNPHILTFWLGDESEEYKERPREDNILGTRVWLRVMLSNESQVSTSILYFSLEIRVQGKSYVAERPAFHPPPSTFQVFVPPDIEESAGFGENLATVFKDRKKVKAYKSYPGHLVFDVRGLDFDLCRIGIEYIITVTDPTGGKHPIVTMGGF